MFVVYKGNWSMREMKGYASGCRGEVETDLSP
jgi:hypothetical protein